MSITPRQSDAPMEFLQMTTSVAETQLLGRTLGKLLCDHLATCPESHHGADAGALVLALHGELGAGKTTLTQGIAAGMGIHARVTSPTFTLINEYEGADGALLFHIDGYRLGNTDTDAGLEAAAMGIEEFLAEDGVVVIEWAERIASLLPQDRIDVSLSYAETGAEEPESETRQILCRAAGTAAAAPVSTQIVQALTQLEW